MPSHGRRVLGGPSAFSGRFGRAPGGEEVPEVPKEACGRGEKHRLDLSPPTAWLTSACADENTGLLCRSDTAEALASTILPRKKPGRSLSCRKEIPRSIPKLSLPTSSDRNDPNFLCSLYPSCTPCL